MRNKIIVGSVTTASLILGVLVFFSSQQKQEIRSKASELPIQKTDPTVPPHTEYGEPAVEGKDFEIKIEDGAFQPAEATVKVGTNIVWQNEEKTPQEVTGDGGFHTGPIKHGEKITGISYYKPGTYVYYLKNRPEVKGSIVVTQ